MTQLALPLSDLRREWIDTAGKIIISSPLAQFTADDLRSLVGDPPQPNWLGALMARLVNEGLAEEIGRVKSNRREANGRKVGLYRWRTKE